MLHSLNSLILFCNSLLEELHVLIRSKRGRYFNILYIIDIIYNMKEPSYSPLCPIKYM